MLEKTFYDYFYDAFAIIFPQTILDHQMYGFIIQALCFGMALMLAYYMFFMPFIIGIRFIKKGVGR